MRSIIIQSSLLKTLSAIKHIVFCRVFSFYSAFLILNTSLQIKSVQLIYIPCEIREHKILKQLKYIGMYFHHFCHFLARGCNDSPGMPSVDQKVEDLYLEPQPDGLLPEGQG